MTKDNTILTIDIGSDNLKIAEFDVTPEGGLRLRKFAIAKMQLPEAQGEDAFAQPSDALRARAFDKAFARLLAENNFSARRVRVSLPASSAFMRLSKLPDALGNQDAIDRVVEYEAQQAVPCAMSEVEWDYQLIHHQWLQTVDETDENGKLVEAKVEREEFEALFVAIKNEQIKMYTDAIEDAGFEVLSVTVAPAALFNAAKLTQLAEQEKCSLIINIGSASTSLIISEQNRLFIRSIPTAGNAITAQIAKELNMSMADAEDLKLRQGFVGLGGAYDEPESETADTISKIARNVMTRLHGEINRSINVWRSQHGGSQPTTLLLSGGGAMMPGVTEFFQEKLRMSVDFLNTFGAISLEESIDKENLQLVAPAFQELIGLGLHEIVDCPVNLVLLPRSIRNQQKLNQQKPYFLAAAGILIICLLIFGAGMWRLASFGKNLVAGVNDKLQEAKVTQRNINNLMNQCNEVKGDYEQAVRCLEDRTRWIGLLGELQQLAPDMMWITAIEGVGDESDEDAAARNASTRGDNQRAKTAELSAISAVREIKAIRISGYTLEGKGRNYAFSNFQDELNKCGLFSEVKAVENYSASDSGVANMTKFVCIATLKEPMKK